MSEDNLEQLMIETQSGNTSSYQRLLDQCARISRAYIAKRIKNHADIEDIVQEILFAVHKAKHTYHPERPFKPWLYALAQYKLNDFLRKSYRQRARLVGGDDAFLASFADPTVTFGDLVGEQIDEALSELNDRQKEILKKTKLEGKSSREVAKEMGMSESAVKVAVHRSLKLLKKHYEHIN